MFGTDMPYEAMGIHYDLDIDGMPVLPITEHVLCLMGGGCSATWVQSIAPMVRGNPAIWQSSRITFACWTSWVGLMMWWDMRLRIAGTTWCTHLLMLVCEIPATPPLVR